jgi:hypothetical protein
MPRGYEVSAVRDREVSTLVGIGGGERRAAPCLGVKALMLAMLEDAIRAYLGPAGPSREEAALWITDPRHRWVFSFAVVCEVLGLEPSAVRMAVRRMHGHCAERPPIGLAAAARTAAGTRGCG